MYYMSCDAREKVIACDISQGRVYLRARALWMGQDICILLDGGEKPHIGAVSTATHTDVLSHSLPHHKEEELATMVAKHVQKNFSCTTHCVCGIHIHAITQDEIALVYQLTQSLLVELTEKIQIFLRDSCS